MDNLRYPAIAPDPLAAAGTPQAVRALVGVATWVDGTARIGWRSEGKARAEAAQIAFDAQPILIGLGHQNQRDRQLNKLSWPLLWMTLHQPMKLLW